MSWSPSSRWGRLHKPSSRSRLHLHHSTNHALRRNWRQCSRLGLHTLRCSLRHRSQDQRRTRLTSCLTAPTASCKPQMMQPWPAVLMTQLKTKLARHSRCALTNGPSTGCRARREMMRSGTRVVGCLLSPSALWIA